jgi:hypothetical protein
MLVLLAVLLALIPAIAILYPFLRKPGGWQLLDDEGSTSSELSRRWEAAVTGLRNTELDRAIGNLADTDYRWLREQYMTDAALVMKAMELEEEQERDLLSTIEEEVRSVRERVLGADGEEGPPGSLPTRESLGG